MKSQILILCLIVFAILICLTSCGEVIIETTDVNDFDSTFLRAREYCFPTFLKQEPDPSHDNVINITADYPEMLPRTSDAAGIVSYCVKVVEDLVGEDVQIFVSVKYEDNTEYVSEVNRISNIEKKQTVMVRHDLFEGKPPSFHPQAL